MVLNLTEEVLNNIIKKSIIESLNELDWRTYDRAAKKDYNKKRSNDFALMRDKVFNDEHEYNDHRNGNHMRMQGDVSNPRLEVLTNNNSKDRRHWIKYPEDNKYGYYTKFSSGNEEYPNVDGDKRFARKLAKAHDAINDINAPYEKGRGYVNKDNPTDFHKFLGKK